VNGSRLARLVLRGLVAFLGIVAGAVVLILFWAPPISPYRLAVFLCSMVDLSGAVVVTVVV